MRRHPCGKDGLAALRQCDLVLGPETTLPSLTLGVGFLPTRWLPLFFGTHRERLVQLGGRRQNPVFLLEFLAALPGGWKLLEHRLKLLLRRLKLLLGCVELTWLRCHQVDETLGADSTFLHLLSQCTDDIHADYGSATAVCQLRQFPQIQVDCHRPAWTRPRPHAVRAALAYNRQLLAVHGLMALLLVGVWFRGAAGYEFLIRGTVVVMSGASSWRRAVFGAYSVTMPSDIRNPSRVVGNFRNRLLAGLRRDLKWGARQ